MKNLIWVLAFVFGFCFFGQSALSAGGSVDGVDNGGMTVQQLQDEIAQLTAQLQSLQQSGSASGPGITMPGQGGFINLGQVRASWNTNNNSWGGVETGNANFNLDTIYQLQYGNWNFNAPDANGYWNANYNFGGVEAQNTAMLPNQVTGSSGNLSLKGFRVNESSWSSTYQDYSGNGQIWTSLGADMGATPSLILSSNLSYNEYADWQNPSVTDFYGEYYVSGELYSGAPVNPQEPIEIQEIQSQITYLQTELTSLTAPEPATFALMFAGAMAGLIIWRRR